MIPSIASCDRELRFADVGDEHPRASAGEGGERRHDADGPGADHDRDVAWLNAGLLGRLHADGEWLDHGALAEGDVVRQRVR